MPTFVTHAVVGVALGQAAPPTARKDPRFWYAAAICSMLPDVDVIGHRLGWHWGDVWEHRGFTHSLLFAALTGMVAGFLLGKTRLERLKLILLLILITASHGILDAMTNGGLGIAFFSPFDTTRYFLPWRPLQVTPIGLQLARINQILFSLRREMLLVWPLAVLLGLGLYALRRRWDARPASGAG